MVKALPGRILILIYKNITTELGFFLEDDVGKSMSATTFNPNIFYNSRKYICDWPPVSPLNWIRCSSLLRDFTENLISTSLLMSESEAVAIQKTIGAVMIITVLMSLVLATGTMLSNGFWNDRLLIRNKLYLYQSWDRVTNLYE